MKNRQSSGSSILGIISSIVFFIIMIVLLLVFSHRIIEDVMLSQSVPNVIVLPIIILIPLVLVGALVFHLYRLFRDFKRKRPGARFRIRLLAFFSIIILLAVVPQGLLSVNLIQNTLTSLFDTSLSEALNGGLDIAFKYYHEKIELLREFTESRTYRRIADQEVADTNDIWERSADAFPDLDAIQFFGTGSPAFYGDERCRLEAEKATGYDDGALITRRLSGLRVIQIVKRYDAGGPDARIALSVVISREIDLNASKMTSTIETYNQLDEYQNAFKWTIYVFYFLFAFPLFVLSILISIMISRELVRPIVNLEEATRRVAEGDFSIRILTRTQDELSLLVSSFNQMVQELDNSRKKILQTEKMAAWQEIAQRLAHEIRNPLTPIRLSAERLLAKYRKDPESLGTILEPSIATIISEVDNLNIMLQEFRDFARLPETEMERLDIQKIINDVVSVYNQNYADLEIKTEFEAEPVYIHADKKQLKQVFTNLLKNAAEAMEETGTIIFRIDLVKKGNSNYCRIQVEDNGAGISPEYHDKVFQPYFTTKRHGTGLGLSIVERIIYDQRGQIWFETTEGIGTTFFMDFPMEKQI